MNKATITKILNKNCWTGAELGKLLFTVMADLYQQNLDGVENPTPLVSFDQLRSMVKTIEIPAEGRIFNGYNDIYSWLCVVNPFANSQEQQFNLRYRTLANYLHTAIMAEDAYNYVSKLPVIMTREQLKQTKAERIQDFLYPEGTPRIEYVVMLMLWGIKYYALQLEEDPDAQNPLTEIKKLYQKQKVTSPIVLKGYNEAVDNGYYTLPDGRRSDQMSKEEWQKTISPALYEAIKYSEEHNGEISPERQEIINRRYRRELQFKFDGLPEGASHALALAEDEDADITTKTEWHYYAEAPEVLCKWEILEDSSITASIYHYLAFPQEDTQKAIEELEDFTTEFKEAVDAVLADMDKLGLYRCVDFPEQVQKPLIDSFTALDFADLFMCNVKAEDLYKLNVYGYKSLAESPAIIFENNNRALNNGVAILEESYTPDYKLRNYKEPVITSSFTNQTLEGFFTDSPDYATNINIVESSRKILIDSYYYLKAYNVLLDLLGDYYGIKEIETFKNPEIENLEAKIDAYNTLIPVLYSEIKDQMYTDKALQIKKLETLKDNFSQIHYKKMEISTEALEKVKAELKDFKAFSKDPDKISGKTDWLTKFLCAVPPEYYKY